MCSMPLRLVDGLYDPQPPTFGIGSTAPHALTVSANDDFTTVEIVDEAMLAVFQVDDSGNSQTLMLSAVMAIELSRLIDAFVLIPKGPLILP